MQSIIQYRKFRQKLEGQIERHGLEKVASYAVRPASEIGRAPSRRHHLGLPHQHLTAAEGEEPLGLEEKSSQKAIADGSAGANSSQASGDHPENVEARVDHRSDHLGRSQNDRLRAPAAAHDQSLRALSPPPRSAGPRDQPTATEALPRDAADTLSIVSTRRTQRSDGMGLGAVLTGVNMHTPRTHEKGHGTGDHVFVVGYQGVDDPLNPHNWSIMRRLCYTLLIAKIGLIVGFASSIDSSAAPQAAEEFQVSEIVESLATAAYLCGFGFGAFFAAPLSETFGRNIVYMGTMAMFMIWIMAVALAPNIEAQVVFRFLAGFFGSTPLTCAGGSISDMWNATERTVLFPVFANAAFWGPILGPVIGGFIAQSSVVSWRWCAWVTLIWSGLIMILLVLFLPETYGPTLLKWKATHLRAITGDNRYLSEMEMRELKLVPRILANMYRPFLLFIYEPIAVLFTLYLTVVYVVLFTFLTGFEFIFSETYGLSQGLTFLVFSAMGVGFAFASAFVPWIYKSYRRSLREVEDAGGTHLPPERRLIFAMLGAPGLPIGLFWMAWTSYPSVSVWSPIMSCVPTGFAILGIFISTYQYLIDAYEAHAASALVGVTFIRYIVSAGMLPASIPFYRNLGVHWTLTVLGGIAALMTPVPFIFWKYGGRIRKHSRYAVDSI